MANNYDRIFKENFEALIVPMARKLIGLSFPNLEEIPDDLQHTLERKPDFLKKVCHDNVEQDYILHIEVQLENDVNMVKRMLEYNALLYRIYGLPIRQLLFYIGTSTPTMPTQVAYGQLTFAFELINLLDVEYRTFVESDEPETIILGILGKFEKAEAGEVIEYILSQLQELELSQLRLQKYIVQLEILSKIRNLQDLTIQKLQDMPIRYDLETDIRYQQGVEKGIEKGEAKGEAKKARQVVVTLLKDGRFTNAEIAHFAEVSEVEVEQIRKELDES